MNWARDVVYALAVLTLAYFTALNLLYLVMTVIARYSLNERRRAEGHAALDETFASPLTPAVSIILPAYNEEVGIVESVTSLLALRYPRHEVMVVNDGSTDETVARLHAAFDLVPVRKALRTSIETKPVRGAYVSRHHSNLWVIDKENGGKADALNVGINAANSEYVCAIDADAVLEEDALLRVTKPVFEDPELVIATGGIVRIANGCRIEHGRVLEVGLPRSRLATIQVVEYFRAFLIGRVGWSRMNALLIISGAFGLFRRSLVEEVGGYLTTTVGEDVELVVRLHRHMRESGRDYRVVFVADPVCWTEAPEDFRSLSRQRRRWHRGLGETLWLHRRVIGNPRYGVLGLVAAPYFLFFEFLGAVLELLGPPAIVVWWLLGLLSVRFLVAFLIVAILLGILLSIAALALEELSFRRHERHREVGRLLLYAALENVGYRQLVAFWRFLAFFDLARRKQGWGEMKRKGFGPAASAPLGALPPPPTLRLEPDPAPVTAAPERRDSRGLTVYALSQLVETEAQALVLHDLRAHADSVGSLPPEFDELVEEVFGASSGGKASVT